MKNTIKIFIMLTVIIVMGCSAVFAVPTHINLSIHSKVPLRGEILNVSVDGKHLGTFSESILKSNKLVYNVESNIDLQNNPYNIKIEYIKGDLVKTFNFKSDKKNDVILKYYFDGKNVTDRN